MLKPAINYSILLLTGLLELSSAHATLVPVAANGKALQQAITNAATGDTLQLASGVYRGNFIIDRAITLQGQTNKNGQSKTLLDGNNTGDVLRVTAANVVIKALIIQNSGHNLTNMNAGIFVERSATDIIIRNNTLSGNAFGIWLDGCKRPQVNNNRIFGETQRRSQDRGNGIHLYAVHGGVISGNEIEQTRDGIYIETSKNNRLENNYLHDLRYGIHYMFSYQNKIIGNLTRRTRTGYALMQSKYLTVTGNRSEQDNNYGILMNFITQSTIKNNNISQTRHGQAHVTGGSNISGAEGKALFIYNSSYNFILGNRLDNADIGIHFTAGSQHNEIHSNAFINNRVQVKYVSNRHQEWSKQGRGNYWSDYLGWDVDTDGIGDRPYEPNDAIDKLLWNYPVVRILMNSPAIETLHWVQQQFPVLRAQGVRDSFPLMKPLSDRR